MILKVLLSRVFLSTLLSLDYISISLKEHINQSHEAISTNLTYIHLFCYKYWSWSLYIEKKICKVSIKL